MKQLNIGMLLLVLSFVGISQNNYQVPKGTFNIDLPSYWQQHTSSKKILGAALPLICQELKDKVYCEGRCDAEYSIKLEITDPLIEGRDYRSIGKSGSQEQFEFNTYYSFNATLLLTDKNNMIVTRMLLVDTNEIWIAKRKATISKNNPNNLPALTNNQLVSVQSGRANNYQQVITTNSNVFGSSNNNYINPNTPELYDTPDSYMHGKQRELNPRTEELYKVVNEKILLLQQSIDR
jgi:hypothetical protein